MNLHINFHQMEPTDAIKGIIEKKSKKLEKFFSKTVETEWFLDAGKEGHHARAVLSSQGYHFNADSKTEDLYKAIDEVIHKMEAQIKKKVSKSKNHSNKKLNFDSEDESDLSE